MPGLRGLLATRNPWYVRMCVCVCAFIVNLQTIFICNIYFVIQHSFSNAFKETWNERLRCSCLSLRHFNAEVRGQILFNVVFHTETTSLRERKQSVKFSLTLKPPAAATDNLPIIVLLDSFFFFSKHIFSYHVHLQAKKKKMLEC